MSIDSLLIWYGSSVNDIEATKMLIGAENRALQHDRFQNVKHTPFYHQCCAYAKLSVDKCQLFYGQILISVRI